MPEIHPIQLKILQDLLFTTSARYSALKPGDLEGSKFAFHLDRLLSDGFLKKTSRGLYSLTEKGKEFANRMDTQQTTMREQAKSTTIICATREKNGTREFLLYKRMKNPFHGHIGFPTHKFWFGQSVFDAAQQGLFIEANLRGEPKMLAIRHYTVFHKNILREDKVMYVFRLDNVIGELENKQDGEFFWLSETDLDKLQCPFLPEFHEVLEILKNSFIKDSTLTFKEARQDVLNF